MKNIKLLLFTFLISTGFTFGQLENKVTYTEYDATKVVINDGEEHVAEAFKVTEELTPIILNPEDQYKLNQNFISLPTQVTKKVRLDFAPPLYR